jgi:sugar/nucleoside kinase (ribokinase family)
VDNQPIQMVVFGDIQRDFIISVDGKTSADIPGGSALYFAIGAAVWKKDRVGIVSQVGDDFPISRLNFLKNHGIDISGIQVLPHPVDNRAFHSGIRNQEQGPLPSRHYISLEKDLPRELLGYHKRKIEFAGRINDVETRPSRLPSDYLKSHLTHFCSVKTTYQLAQTSLMQSHYPGRISQFTAEVPSERKSREQLAASMVSSFCVTIKKKALLEMFALDGEDYREIITGALQIGSDIVIVLLGEQGRLVLESKSKKKWFVPLYPLRAVNPTGKNHAFCGGFAATIRNQYDPLEAVLAGAVSYSLVAEGIGINYALDAPPQLLESRLSHLRGLVRRI